jgi:hypothetical protein
MTVAVICLAVLSSALLGCVMILVRWILRGSDSLTTKWQEQDRSRSRETLNLVQTLCSSFFATTPRSTSEPSTQEDDRNLQPAWDNWDPETALEEEQMFAMGSWGTESQARRTVEEAVIETHSPPTLS